MAHTLNVCFLLALVLFEVVIRRCQSFFLDATNLVLLRGRNKKFAAKKSLKRLKLVFLNV